MSWITVKEAAALADTSLATIYAWLREGKVAGQRRVGRTPRILVDRASLERFLAGES